MKVDVDYSDGAKRMSARISLWPIFMSVLAAILLIFFVVLLLVKLLWAWTIPDLFPGAVEQGLVARDISWWTSLKLAIFLAVLAGVAGIRRRK